MTLMGHIIEANPYALNDAQKIYKVEKMEL